MTTRYFTLFDSRYLMRGLAMLRSLTPYLRGEDEIVILAMDDVATRALAEFGEPKWRIISIDTMADADLMNVRRTRPAREFFWTCTPAISAWMVRSNAEGDIVVYLDADLMFFADPRLLLDELGQDGNILIHEHRFSADKEHLIVNGRFNVGLVAFRIGDEARACAERWRAQTIERCEGNSTGGYFADQAYLDEWPSLYPGCRILQHLGGGVAPWNVNQYKIGQESGLPTIDGQQLVFYHYHALETIIEPGHGFIAVRPAFGYAFGYRTLNKIYRPYAKELKKIEKIMASRDYNLDGGEVRNWLDVVVGVVTGRYVYAA